jgi:hypothetical protein
VGVSKPSVGIAYLYQCALIVVTECDYLAPGGVETPLNSPPFLKVCPSVHPPPAGL